MKIGVPKEIKIHEYRVGLVPAGVRELVDSACVRKETSRKFRQNRDFFSRSERYAFE